MNAAIFGTWCLSCRGKKFLTGGEAREFAEGSELIWSSVKRTCDFNGSSIADSNSLDGKRYSITVR